MTDPLVVDGDGPAASAPVARVAVDMALAHLDRPFDYRVPPALDAQAQPGARVRVRFAGRLRDGFVLARPTTTEVTGTLSPLERVVSSDMALSPTIARLVRAVADHQAGTFADVVRLAVPPRHATTEKTRPERPAPLNYADSAVIDGYPTGSEFLAALRRGGVPRALWTLTPGAGPSGDWVTGFVEAAGACLASGRGALLLVPDRRDLAVLERACHVAFGKGAVATLTAEQGPAARYRQFLAVTRGDVRLVIGTRAAAFAPVHDLGLVAVWDAGDDLFSEPRAPYPHARDVVALRAGIEPTAVLFAGYHVPAELAAWVHRGWLTPLTHDLQQRRREAPGVRAAIDSDAALARDPAGAAARLPHVVFEAIRAGLARGPVLVQVPRAGYQIGLSCQRCRTPARCAACHGALQRHEGGATPACAQCGRLEPRWSCAVCGDPRLRAPRVGAERTAEELGRAFPHVRVVSSQGERIVDAVEGEPALVIATPGGEPRAADGFAAAVLLDADLLLQRADLRAGEEALRRWLNATALVRPGAEDGTVVIVGPSSARPVQALVRVDATGFAERELADRAEAGFPPEVKLITVEGRSSALQEFAAALEPPAFTEILGPVEVGWSRDEVPVHRLTLRCSLPDGPALARSVAAAAAVRSARKDDGATRVKVDPARLG